MLSRNIQKLNKMTSKSVLSKILALLSSEEINFTDAKSADGDILQSPTFDLNESVEVVHADGTKSPAPDGEYTISLKDESGNENIIRIEVKDGKIESRENVEEEKNEEEEEMQYDQTTPVDESAQTQVTPSANTPVGVAPVTQMATETIKEAPKDAAKSEEAKALPNTTDEDPRNSVGSDTDDMKDPIISLEEDYMAKVAKLEDMMAKVMKHLGMDVTEEETNPKEEETETKEEDVKMSEVEEEELPKLDGAPIESATRFSADTIHKPNFGKKVGNSQSNFLSKLYS